MDQQQQQTQEEEGMLIYNTDHMQNNMAVSFNKNRMKIIFILFECRLLGM